MATATATVTATATGSATSNIARPMRGISIIIESATATSETAATTTTTTSTISNSNAEMSLKSQAGMLLAFGDSNSNTNSNTTKDNLETSCNIEEMPRATSVAAAATTTATKIYPQLLLRIGQPNDNGENATKTEVATATAATATPPPVATPAAATTIISCNVLPADSVDVAATREISSSDIAVAASTAATSPDHTVKIQIESHKQSHPRNLGKQISVVKLNDSEAMIYQQHQEQQQHDSAVQQQHLCFLVSSGQYSPCETLDSGTGSDLESVKSPESGNQVPKLELHLKSTRLKVIDPSEKSPSRAYSLTDSDELQEYESSSSSSLSCDSLHSTNSTNNNHQEIPDIQEIHEIRDTIATKIDGRPLQYEADRYYNFHVNEHDNFRSFGSSSSSASSSPEYESSGGYPPEAPEDAFAGYGGKAPGNSTIRSAKGTVRGVKNRVRNGVATFLQLQQPNVKNYLEKDMGKVVLYTTSMGIIRDTYAKCANVKQILRTLLIKFEERDVFMSVEYQQEMRERMHDETIRVPQLFVEGQHLGDADTVERLNESGELRQLLKPYKSIATAYTCQTCGGYRLLPCPSCSGSKKSVHRNHFTTEFVALKCMNCDEVGLVKCPNC
ncbi:glutaredoxin domain-containing cysteine-rich protein CG12206 isoform X2 [Drosophila ananassae]|nr:glutaredoxin domain-containing cysteine-rich protein CG12206 isoform X2 [Drosophila ananassae]